MDQEPLSNDDSFQQQLFSFTYKSHLAKNYCSFEISRRLLEIMGREKRVKCRKMGKTF